MHSNRLQVNHNWHVRVRFTPTFYWDNTIFWLHFISIATLEVDILNTYSPHWKHLIHPRSFLVYGSPSCWCAPLLVRIPTDAKTLPAACKTHRDVWPLQNEIVAYNQGVELCHGLSAVQGSAPAQRPLFFVGVAQVILPELKHWMYWAWPWI